MREKKQMRVSSVLARLAIFVTSAVLAVSCSSGCGLGRHSRATLMSPDSGSVPCCGGFLFKDVTLTGNGDAQLDLTNTAMPAQPGLVDAFLVPTSCAQLFSGEYPGAAPLCQVAIGPVPPGAVSPRVPVPGGTYRVWLQAYSSNTNETPFVVDVGLWDHSCRSPLQ